MKLGRGKEFSNATRKVLRSSGICAQCKIEIGGVAGEDDHIIPSAIGGTNDPSNGQLLCIACHKLKTRKDRKIIAKIKRIIKKREAPLKAKHKWPKRKLRSANRLRKQDRKQ